MKVPEEAEAVVEEAREDVAARQEVAPGQVQVLKVEAVDWPDASLGNPQPGHMYAQVITPGWRIVLGVGGKRYVYHADRRRAVYVREQ